MYKNIYGIFPKYNLISSLGYFLDTAYGHFAQVSLYFYIYNILLTKLILNFWEMLCDSVYYKTSPLG